MQGNSAKHCKGGKACIACNDIIRLSVYDILLRSMIYAFRHMIYPLRVRVCLIMDYILIQFLTGQNVLVTFSGKEFCIRRHSVLHREASSGGTLDPHPQAATCVVVRSGFHTRQWRNSAEEASVKHRAV